MIIIGAQLYTVRKLLTTDEEIKSTLKKIKNIGYNSVQLFGSVELIEKHAKLAKEEGLDIVGALTELSPCKSYEKELFEICDKYDIKDIGVSSSFEEYQQTDLYINEINDFAKKARQNGFSFSYHNHGHEFIRLDDGETAMNHFLKGFDNENVDFMPDTYWIHDGGYDVRRFLENTKGRVKILHLKDFKRLTQGHTYAELGNGNLYFEGIVKTALDCGIKHFVVEQDACEIDPVESLKISYKYIKTLLEG